LTQLHSHYMERILKVTNKDTDKIHTPLNQALPQTGRWRSTERNMQNIPVRLEEGRKIRQALIPQDEDWVIFASDYSQSELRVLSHISGDQKLSEAFNEEKDIHTQTATDGFQAAREDVDGNRSGHTRTNESATMYGIRSYRVSQ